MEAPSIFILSFGAKYTCPFIEGVRCIEVSVNESSTHL